MRQPGWRKSESGERDQSLHAALRNTSTSRVLLTPGSMIVEWLWNVTVDEEKDSRPVAAPSRRPHLAEQSGDQFRDRWMNGNSAREPIVGDAGVDDVENTVDRLVAAGAEDRGAQDLLRLCIDSDFHQPLCFAFLDGAPHLGHRSLSNQKLAAGRSRLLLGHADTSERRVDVERITDHALAHAAVFAIQ